MQFLGTRNSLNLGLHESLRGLEHRIKFCLQCQFPKCLYGINGPNQPTGGNSSWTTSPNTQYPITGAGQSNISTSCFCLLNQNGQVWILYHRYSGWTLSLIRVSNAQLAQLRFSRRMTCNRSRLIEYNIITQRSYESESVRNNQSIGCPVLSSWANPFLVIEKDANDVFEPEQLQ